MEDSTAFLFGLLVGAVLFASSHGIRGAIEEQGINNRIEQCARVTTVSDDLCKMIVTGKYVIPDDLYNENAGR